MELSHQIIPSLKRLRLSGVLETLDLRNQQAIDGRWSYVEFLSRLVEDEVERREQKQLGLRLRRAMLGSTKTLEGFDFAFNPNLNRQQILDLVPSPSDLDGLAKAPMSKWKSISINWTGH